MFLFAFRMKTAAKESASKRTVGSGSAVIDFCLFALKCCFCVLMNPGYAQLQVLMILRNPCFWFGSRKVFCFFIWF